MPGRVQSDTLTCGSCALTPLNPNRASKSTHQVRGELGKLQFAKPHVLEETEMTTKRLKSRAFKDKMVNVGDGVVVYFDVRGEAEVSAMYVESVNAHMRARPGRFEWADAAPDEAASSFTETVVEEAPEPEKRSVPTDEEMEQLRQAALEFVKQQESSEESEEPEKKAPAKQKAATKKKTSAKRRPGRPKKSES